MRRPTVIATEAAAMRNTDMLAPNDLIKKPRELSGRSYYAVDYAPPRRMAPVWNSCPCGNFDAESPWSNG